MSTKVTWKDQYAIQGEKPREYDLIVDYFRLPRTRQVRMRSRPLWEFLVTRSECTRRGKKRAFWEMFNPINWIANAIRLPFTIMERAGFASHEMMVGTTEKRFGS